MKEDAKAGTDNESRPAQLASQNSYKLSDANVSVIEFFRTSIYVRDRSESSGKGPSCSRKMETRGISVFYAHSRQPRSRDKSAEQPRRGDPRGTPARGSIGDNLLLWPRLESRDTFVPVEHESVNAPRRSERPKKIPTFVSSFDERDDTRGRGWRRAGRDTLHIHTRAHTCTRVHTHERAQIHASAIPEDV